MLLLTPPLSNILQDIETLHLIGRIVTELCSLGTGRGGVSESEVLRNAFELLSSFDEVVSLGYRERVGMSEVRAAMEMESHEERIQEIIARVCRTAVFHFPNAYFVSCRTRNKKRKRSSSEERNSSKCSAERCRDVVRIRMQLDQGIFYRKLAVTNADLTIAPAWEVDPAVTKDRTKLLHLSSSIWVTTDMARVQRQSNFTPCANKN